RWARAARRSLFEHGLAPAEQGGPSWRDDAAVFLDWSRDFEAELDRNEWVDPDSLLYRLNRSGVERIAGDLILLDSGRATPEVERLIERLRAAGRRIDRIAPDDHEARVGAVIAADPADEIRLAAGWAQQRLREQPGSRLAVVVPDLDSRRDEVEAVFADRLGEARLAGTGGRPVGDIAILGAAVTALRLLGGGGFETMSRWLRSPFFSSRDDARERQAARIELALRGDPRAQGDFVDAWRRYGLDRLFARYLPDASQGIDQALDRLPACATPTGWTAAWQSCLRTLGWHGIESGLPARLQSAWDNAWARFSELTPITGVIDQGTALEALTEIVATESIYDPIALDGVTILSRPDRIGPGFAGAWLTGFTDQAPVPEEGPNPLLPWVVQAQLDMPGAKPETALAVSIEDLDRLRRRVPEARFSCPARVGDEPRMPSPLIAGWQRTGAPVGQSDGSYAAARIGARGWQLQADSAPAFAGEAIPGGARTLDLQSGCPVKAFCVARLRAEPVEPPARGVDPKLRGLLLHRALELVLDPGGSGVPTARIGDAVEQAVASVARRADAGWRAQLGAERDRLERIIARLLEIDASRAAFATVAVEHRTQIPIGGRVVNCRIDRIDRLASGEIVLIDYKTGQSPLSRWFEARPGDCQLPLYAQGSEPGAIAAVRLDDSRIDYRWAGRAPLSVPGSGRSFDVVAWRAQIVHWHEQIGELVGEFAAGDVRVPFDAAEHVAADGGDRAGGAFAPLTRVGDAR
ncbi:MAG TPA: PD-(D/E)XK nuclease family protein, partial [Gammaproteobacteria bacterium]|nr:PD-(D/E)XK nuclease family protein [Gammaproteobacteria bacterium]